MRKTFKLFCAAVVAALAVSSCGKIWDEFDNVQGQLDSIEARLDSLETALNADVANLAALDATHAALDKAVKDLETALKAADAANAADIKALQESVAALQAQLAGVKVESKNGTVVVTIGENSFTLSQNGVLTIVEVEGVKYWALVDPATGKATNLNVKVGHDLKFKVDPETAEVLICYDGTEYVGTGVYAADGADTLIGEVEETDDYVTITIGDATYELEKWADDKSVLGLSRADFFLRYTATKKIELTAEDITEYYVMAKPDGWKATLDGKTLTVVAPSKAAIEFGAAEEKGEVLIHATTVEGKCKVAKVDVTTGPGMTISVDTKGNIKITNSYVGEYSYREGWDVITGFGFQSFALGFAAPEFLDDVDSFMTFVHNNYSTPDGSNFVQDVYSVFIERGEYVDAEYETDVVETSVSAVIEDLFYEEVNYGDRYIVWAAPVDSEGRVVAADVAYADFTYFDIKVEATATTHKDITLSISAKGADSYAIGFVAESEYAKADNPTTFDKYMTDAQGGRWTYFTKYSSPDAMNMLWTDMNEMHTDETIPATINLTDLNYGDDLIYGETYKVWVMPMFDHKAVLDETQSMPDYGYYFYDYSAYDFEKDFLPYVFEFKTKDVVAGSPATVTLGTEEIGYDYVSVPFTVTGAEKVFYHWFTSDEYNELSTEAETIAAVFKNCRWPETANGIFEKTYLTHGTSTHLVVVAVDADGKYSILKKSYKTLTVDYNEATVSLDEITMTSNFNYTVSLSVTGATQVAIFGNYINEDEEEEAIAIKTYETNVLSHNSYVTFADVVDGKVTVDVRSYYPDMYIWGINVDTEGVITDMSATPLVFNIEENLPADAE